jgi:glycosyltransferase involved in cell wall biosynthesis
MSPLSLALVVQGRFHAFDLARALLARGHDVTIFTNYPASTGPRFGLPKTCLRSFVAHGLLDRAAVAAARRLPAAYPEERLHRLFGAWASRQIARRSWHAVHCWSGVSQELLEDGTAGGAATLLMRGSAHITVQDRLLGEEAARAGVPLDRPSPWMISRELREYALADRLVVLSSFAQATCVAEGIDPARLSVLPLGVDVGAFRASAAARAARDQRIRSGQPLRVLYTGALSFQKGLLDLVAVAEALRDEPFEFTLVGPSVPETAPLLSALGPHVRRVGKLAQAALPAVYAEADLFLFPTIQDGFGMVLTQAKAAGLPIITTTHSAGPDLVTEGRDGWVVPIRDRAALTARLRWCGAHRSAFADLAAAVDGRYRPRDWATVAADFEQIAWQAWEAKERAKSTPVARGSFARTGTTDHER